MKNEANITIHAAAQKMGFEPCEFNGVCEKCEKENQKLYFGNTNYWDSREGEYWCGECVRNMHIQNICDYSDSMK